MTGITEVNLRWAFALLDGLVRAGLRDVVISPGSRSTPLVLAADHHPQLQVRVQLDERSAAFYGLGIARAARRPVALIATSGSAPAHWHPAVIEADQAGVPLLLLSADRPPALQGCGANQTIDQIRLFGTALRGFHALPVADEQGLASTHHLGMRAMHQSRWPLPGPVQINVPFEEPLVPTSMPVLTPSGRETPVETPTLHCPAAQLARVGARLTQGPGLIVCGPGDFTPGFATAVSALAAQLDCPLLADPLSGLRCGGHDRSRVMTRYDAFLRRPQFTQRHRPAWVLRFGAMPVSKVLADYLATLEQDHLLLVDPSGRWLDPLHQVGEMLRGDPGRVCQDLLAVLPISVASEQQTWQREFSAAERLAEDRLPADAGRPWFEADLVETLLDELPENALLFCGNSMPIRDLDSFSGDREKPLRLVANRGASGIDGLVSTCLGIAAASPKDTVVVGLIGDLSLYHDLNGLMAARGLDATLVVVDNGGGGIFRYLPQAGLDAFEPYWLTPTNLDLGDVARLYGLNLQRVEDREPFREALRKALSRPGVDLIQAVIEPQASVDQHRRWWQAIGQETGVAL
jgi:2-succinyl-5-enolpyruvyl-6-hydroxy-3-cyclohexene-1-carboxylate synthase